NAEASSGAAGWKCDNLHVFNGLETQKATTRGGGVEGSDCTECNRVGKNCTPCNSGNVYFVPSLNRARLERCRCRVLKLMSSTLHGSFLLPPQRSSTRAT